MNIGFIGAGKVGFSLLKYFSVNKNKTGVKISGIYNKRYSSAKSAAEFINCAAFENISDLIKNSDFIFITVPDDEIINVWNEINKFDIKNKIICHTSGSISSDIFTKINFYDAYGYSIHPMFPFSDKYNCYKSLDKSYFTIEGSNEKLNLITEFFNKMGNKVLIIDKSKKALYHLANVTVSNLVLSLINKGCTYLKECGVKENTIDALMPLIKNNIENINNKGFIDSLTGPVERNDESTIKKHLDVIPQNDINLYKNLTDNLLSLSQIKHPERNNLKIKKLLK